MNSVYFFEIQASNPALLRTFYEAVFGWEFTKQDGLPIEYYQIKTEGINGGLLQRPTETPGQGQGTNAFTCSMQVEDFDATAEKILANGGIVALEKFAVPGKCWQGYFLDPDNNTLGLFQVDESAL
jgi:predicted enzyme related to lactoylglutathione lyase